MPIHYYILTIIIKYGSCPIYLEILSLGFAPRKSLKQYIHRSFLGLAPWKDLDYSFGNPFFKFGDLSEIFIVSWYTIITLVWVHILNPHTGIQSRSPQAW